MRLDLLIDELTPCLERKRDGKIVDTFYTLASSNDLCALNDWLFDWTHDDLKGSKIYKLMAEDDQRIQGLIAVRKMPRDRAIYVQIAESAPHNKSGDKEYIGVGGHLFAIAVRLSYENGFDGFVYMDAKNTSLVSHYARTLGAIFIGHPHPYRMIIDEEAAYRLIQKYNFRRDSNV
ncbi:MAG: hypothetical protein II916_05145 [Oscillospiraceae bacterium]|nr:hypothetical protein [Oscillospiraceae bacterium]